MYAEDVNLDVYQYSPAADSDPAIHADLASALQERYQVDIVILAGFIKVSVPLRIADKAAFSSLGA